MENGLFCTTSIEENRHKSWNKMLIKINKSNSNLIIEFTNIFKYKKLPLAILHHGKVTYVKNAFSGTDCARLCSFQKWNVCVNPLIVHNGL